MSEKKCFIISPIGEAGSEIRRRADQVLKHVITPSVIECGFEQADIVRADTISNPGAITHQIITSIIHSELVIADLTGNNANVYYELAIRHALRKPYVQICDINTALPFDVKNQRTIMFDYKDLDSVAEAKYLLSEYAKSALSQPDNLMTPIHEGLVIEGLLSSDKPSEQILGQLLENFGELSEQVKKISNHIFKDNRNIYTPSGSFLEFEEEIEEFNNMKKYQKALKKVLEYEKVLVGDMVEHPKWGLGKITSKKGEGQDTEITAEFKEPVGTKRILLAFAPVKIIQTT